MLSCPHCTTRRDFLERLGGGFGALALAALQAQAARPPAVTVDPVNPFAPRRPHFAPKAKSVIFLFQVGGPSPVDTFDYKPTLQKLNGKPVPESIKDAVKATKHANVFVGCKEELMASPFQWAQHGQSGM